jgi:hypothetical protein
MVPVLRVTGSNLGSFKSKLCGIMQWYGTSTVCMYRRTRLVRMYGWDFGFLLGLSDVGND